MKKDDIIPFLSAHRDFAPFGAGMHHFNSICSGDNVYLTFDGNKLIDKTIVRNLKHAFKINYFIKQFQEFHYNFPIFVDIFVE